MQTLDTTVWKSVGKVAGFLVGFLVVLVVNYYISPQLAFPAGLIAGFVVYYQCTVREKNAMKTLCNPPEEIWPIPLPYAWGTVKEVLNREGYESADIGRRTWENIKEDDSRAILTADLRFTEKHTEFKLVPIHELANDRSEMASRGITITVKFVPDKATKGTRVTFVYEPHMQKGDDRAVREIIAKMRKKFPERMEINKKELGL